MDLDRDVLDGLDKLAKECLGADWAACDELAACRRDALPGHRQYGAACGGREDDPVRRCNASPTVRHPRTRRWRTRSGAGGPHADGRSHEHQAVTVADPGEAPSGQASDPGASNVEAIGSCGPLRSQMCSASADEP